MTDVRYAELRARSANAPDLWDRIWRDKGQAEWRGAALARVYARIAQLVPIGSVVADVGGGVGVLAGQLKATCAADVTVFDHSKSAEMECRRAGLKFRRVDLEVANPMADPRAWMVSTECVEHLSAKARARIFRHWAGLPFLCSVPNNRLGPDEEPQHTVKFTAVTFAAELRAAGHVSVRIEPMGPYLLAVCGKPAAKSFRLALTLPVRDEARDLEATLASFRGVADVIVVGVDPRTVDDTRAIAAAYADDVFDLVDPEGPSDERMPPGGVHFSWLRNQCIDRCKVHGVDWIFMTEGHERLAAGADQLLRLDALVGSADVVSVLREASHQRWAFPWLFRPKPGIHFKRAIHNTLEFPEGAPRAVLPKVRTYHERHPENAARRAAQRDIQNAGHLYEDWHRTGNLASLYYLAQDIRAKEPARAIEVIEEFIAQPGSSGPMCYQARLMLARLYLEAKRPDDARRVLVPASGDDWSRVEHFVMLGDLAFNGDRLEEAAQFYGYAGTVNEAPPVTTWWIDCAIYGWLTAQRLAMTFAALGRVEVAAKWAERVVATLPSDAKPEELDEARTHARDLRAMVEAGG